MPSHKPIKSFIDQRNRMARCFVMICNLSQNGEMVHCVKDILAAYKEQDGVEKNFSFLKDEAVVNSIFLKKNRTN